MTRIIPLLLVALAGHAAKQPFAPEDLWAWRWLSQPQISPDGEWVTYVESWYDRGSDAVRAEMRVVSTDGTGRRRSTSGDLPASGEAPLPSPDGSKIAFLARDSKPQSYTVRKLYVKNADGTRVRALSGSLDRDVCFPQWSSDSRTVYFLADDRGSTHVYAARNDGTVRQVTAGEERLYGFSLAENGRAVVVLSANTSPMELVTFSIYEPEQRTVLASPNQDWLSTRKTGTVENTEYESEGNRIHAWIVKPPDFDATKRYPLLFQSRAAPREMCGAEFDLRARILAAGGAVVVCANPRGTPGYGEVFGNLLPGRKPDLEDVARGLKFFSAQAYVDPTKVTLFEPTAGAPSRMVSQLQQLRTTAH